MPGGQDVRAGRAFVEIVLRNKVKQGLDKVASQFRTFGKLTAGIGAGLSAASAGIIAPLAAAVSQFSAVGDAVDKMAARTGLSTEAVSELTHAADLSGTSIESLEIGLKKMQDTVVSAARGGKEASLAFRRLGLSGQVLASMSPDKQLEAIADRIARIRNPALRTAVALDIFGKSGTELIPLLAEGASGIQKMRAEAKRLGLSMDRETASAAAALNDALATVWATVKGVTIQVGAALAPTVTDLANRLSGLLGGVTKWIKENRGLVVIAAAVAIGLGVMGAGLTALGVASVAASMAFTGLGRIVGGLGLIAGKVSASLAAPFRSARERFVALGKSAGFVGSSLSRIGQRASVVASAMSSIGTKGVAGLKQIAIGATTAASAMAGLSIQGAAKAFQSSLNAMARGAQQAWSTIHSGAKSASNGIASALRTSIGYVGAFKRGFTGELVLATTKGNSALNALGRGVRDVFNRLAPVVTPAVRPIATTLQTLWTRITQDAMRTRAAIATGWQAIPTTLKSAVRPASSAMNVVWTEMKQNAATARAAIASTWQAIPASIRQPLSHVARIAQSAGSRAGSAFSGALRGASSTAGSAWLRLKTAGFNLARQVSQQIRSRMSTAFAAVRSTGLRAFATIKAAGVGAMRTVASATRTIGGKISSGFGKIGSSAAILGGILGDALGIPFLSAIPLIAAAVGAIGAALAALLSPVGLLTAAIAGGIYAFFRWTDAGKNLFAQLKQSFGGIFAIAKQTVGGIASAIAAGDLKMAARIAWLGITAVWQAGIIEIQRLWPLVVEGASQVWGIISQAAAQAGQYVAGVWAQLPSWLTGPLGQVGQLVSLVAGWISDQFRAIIGPVVETVVAIGKAISAGEWGLAAEIAWTSIRAAFGNGVAWVTNLWTEFSTGLASIFDGAITGIRKIWNNVSTFIASQLVQLIGGIQKALDALSQVDPTGIANKLKASLAIDVQGTLKNLEEDRIRFNTDLDQKKQQRDLNRGKVVSDQAAATQQQLADLQKQRDNALARIGSLAASGDTKDQQSKLAAALSELQAAVNLAAEQKGSVLGDHSDKTDSLASTNEKIVDESAKVASQGTFTAAAAAGLGIGGINDKSLRAQLDSADYLRQLVQLGKRGRLVFG